MIRELKRELSKLSGVDFFNPKYADVFKKYLSEEDNTEDVENLDKTEQKSGELVEDIDKAEDEREIDKIEEEKAETPKKEEEKKEEVNKESEEIGKKVDEEKADFSDALLDAKIEIALLKNNIRDDKMGVAKDYVKYAIRDSKDLNSISDIVKQFPDWIKSENKREVEKIGMDIKNDDDLTAVERRMKELGINPR